MQPKLSKLQKAILTTVYDKRENPQVGGAKYVCEGHEYEGLVCAKYQLNKILGKKFDKMKEGDACGGKKFIISASFLVSLSNSLRSLIRRGLILGLHETHLRHWKERGRDFFGRYGYLHYDEYELRPVKAGESISYIALTEEGEKTVQELVKNILTVQVKGFRGTLFVKQEFVCL